jgi:hypothetical protein
VGGLGSGRRSTGSAKRTTDGLFKIDIRRWQQKGLLVPGTYFGWGWQAQDEKFIVHVQVGLKRIVAEKDAAPRLDGLRLQYSLTERGAEPQSIDQVVQIISTPCHFGGARRWFECPGPSCDGRRVATLFLGGTYFLCRNCCGLAYSSERADAAGRALGRLRKIRRRLGASEDELLFSLLPPRPKGMRRVTYARLKQKAEQADAEHLAAVTPSLLALEHAMRRLFVDWVPQVSWQDPLAEALLMNERETLERVLTERKRRRSENTAPSRDDRDKRWASLLREE